MDGFVVRAASSKDVSPIMEIARECSLESWSENAYREEIGSADGLVLVAERPDGNIVGFFVGRIVPGPDKDNADAEIYNVGVSESWRRIGAAATLLDRFLDQCHARNTGVVWLEVRASNSGALSFYEAAGFKRAGLRQGFYRSPAEDAVIMKLGLKDSGR